MFHWTDDRIIGHLRLCFLSYFCEAHLSKRLRKAQVEIELKSIDKKIIKSQPLTVVLAMEKLSQVMAMPVIVKKETIWLRTYIPSN
jgi:hypothetical protein